MWAWRASRSPPRQPGSFNEVPHAASRRRAAVGGKLRLQQRRRGAAAVQLPRQRFDHRRRMDQPASHAARRIRWVVVRQPRRHAHLGQPAASRRWSGVAGTGSHVALAVEPGSDRELRRLHEARAPNPAHRIPLLRSVDQRLDAAAVHDQRGAADAPPSTCDDGGRGAGFLDQSQPGVPAAGQLAAERAATRVRFRQRDPARRHPAVRQLRLGGERLAAHRSGAVRAQPADVCRRRHVDGAPALRAGGRIYA